MSWTTTMVSTDETIAFPERLSDSLGSLDSSRRSYSQFSKPYKLASNYFLTRRFAEAYLTILPIFSYADPDSNISADQNERNAAPIAKAGRKWRVKLWSLYITLHNSIIQLGAEEAKAAIGRNEWEKIVSKVMSGSIWDEIVEVGYRNSETAVDGEVVVNIANLLLSQSPDQRATQEHLETYLSAAPLPDPAGRRDHVQPPGTDDNRASQKVSSMHDLEIYNQIIEIFALHVLPSNDEWEYAQEFVKANCYLDNDRREAFLQTLHDLEGDEILDNTSRAPLPSNNSEVTQCYGSSRLGRADSEVTVIPAASSAEFRGATDREPGIEESLKGAASQMRVLSPKPMNGTDQHPNQENAPHAPKSPGPSDNLIGTTEVNDKKPILRRSFIFWSLIGRIRSEMVFNLNRSPAGLLRFILFVTTLLVALSRKDLRLKLQSMSAGAFNKVKKTLGMGVKVSYV